MAEEAHPDLRRAGVEESHTQEGEGEVGVLLQAGEEAVEGEYPHVLEEGVVEVEEEEDSHQGEEGEEVVGEEQHLPVQGEVEVERRPL